MRGDFEPERVILALSGLILCLRANFGSKMLDFRLGRANFGPVRAD